MRNSRRSCATPRRGSPATGMLIDATGAFGAEAERPWHLLEAPSLSCTAHAGESAAGSPLVTAHGMLCTATLSLEYSSCPALDPEEKRRGTRRRPTVRDRAAKAIFPADRPSPCRFNAVARRVLCGAHRDARRQRGQRGDNVQFRRCPFPHTPRCPYSIAIRPTKSASLCVLTGSTLGSRYEGGATPPPAGNVDPTTVDVCPLVGRRSPLENRSRGSGVV